MHFAIEVAGEANPLSLPTLYQTLSAASSTDPQQIKSGAQQLQNWEKQSGFYSSLQSIFIDVSLPVEVRHLCVIQLKNGVDKYWRKTATNSISRTEKDQIRSRCIGSGIKEPNPRLALQNAVMIAKIVRYEYPADWPDAISSIVSSLRSVSQSNTNSLELTRTLLILLEVIKELSTARIQRTRVSLQAAASEVLQVLGSLYHDKARSWLTFLAQGNDGDAAVGSIEQSLLALRVLRRTLVAGWDFPNRSPQFQDIWTLLNDHFRDILALISGTNVTSRGDVRKLTEKHLRQIAKLHVNIAKDHPAGFSLLESSVPLLSAYWDLVNQFGETFGSHTIDSGMAMNGRHGESEDRTMSLMEFLSLKGLQLVRACLKIVFNPARTFKYQNDEDKAEKAQSRDLLKSGFLTEAFAQTAMQTLVTRFFVLRPDDVRDWNEQPEEWEQKETGDEDVAEFSVRPCAEKLFLDLILNYKMQLIHPLMSVFGHVAGNQTQDVFLKNSVYAAIGLAAPVLEDRIDFNLFLTETLKHEVQLQQPGYNVLRRRISIVLGQWLVVKNGLDRELVYQIFQHLLNKDDQYNDLVVRITAGRQLKEIILPFEFDKATFEPYGATILTRLMALIEEVELSETKFALLGTLSVVIQSMEEQISPFADEIVAFLPPLWEQAGKEFLTKQLILGILSTLISALKGESQKYYHLIIPLIDNSVNAQSESYEQLVEDALGLWEAVLQQTSSGAVPQLTPLAPRLFPMLEAGSDVLPTALNLTETYVYLAPREMLQSMVPLLPSLTSLLKGARREVTGSVLSIVELLMRSALDIGGDEALHIFTLQLLNAHFLQNIVAGLRGAYESHQTTGPNRTKTWLDVLVETDYLSLLSRLALSSPSLLLDGLVAAMPEQGKEESIGWILTEWFRHLDNISHPEKKKLNCLALTALLKTNQPWILIHLQDLMTLWTEVILELYDDGEATYDLLVYRNPDGMQGERETAEEERQRKLMFGDPVHRLDVKAFVREHVHQAIEAVGGEAAFQTQWVVNVDQAVLREFGRLGVM
ncbi:MAG: hypothetical protein LQ352_003820 [Teloschistes flavicans]|nr:MAG: hypothetical protein LQ352_003820 [Teloschistes flavicans]